MSLFSRKGDEKHHVPAPIPFEPGEIEIIGEEPKGSAAREKESGQGPLIRGKRRATPPRSRPISWSEVRDGPDGSGPLEPIKPAAEVPEPAKTLPRKSGARPRPVRPKLEPDELIEPLRPARSKQTSDPSLPGELPDEEETGELESLPAQEAAPKTEVLPEIEVLSETEQTEPEKSRPVRIPDHLDDEEADRARRLVLRQQRQVERKRKEEEERQRRMRSQTRRQRRAERIRRWRADRKDRRERKLQAKAEQMLRSSAADPRSRHWSEGLPLLSRFRKKEPKEKAGRAQPAFIRRLKGQIRQRQAERARQRWSDVVGLDIGASTIRAAFFSGGQAYLYEKQIPEGIIIDGLLAEPEELSEELRQLWKEGGIPSDKVNFSITNRLVVVRAISLPAEYEEDIEQALALNAAPIVAPMNPDETIIDYAELSRVGPQVSLQVAAADIDMSRSYMEAVEAAGLLAASAEVGSLAGHRAVVIPRSAQQTHGIIDIGAELTTVSVASGPDTFFFRTIESGGNDFTRSLLRLDLGWSEVERVKAGSGIGRRPVDGGIDAHDFRLLRQAMQPVADNLCQEILQTQDLYERSETGRQKPVAGYTVIGGGAKLEGLAEQISSATGRPCSTDLKPWPGLDAIDVDFGLWAPALGLGQSNSMSLLPPASSLFARNRRRHSKISPSQARSRAKEMAPASSNPLVSKKLLTVFAVLVALLGMFLWAQRIRSGTEAINKEASAQSRTAEGLKKASGAAQASRLRAEIEAKPDWAQVSRAASGIVFNEIQTSGSEVRLTGPNRGPLELPPGAEQKDVNRSITEVTIRRQR